MSVGKPQSVKSPILLLVAKAFQTPDIPRAAQEAETFSKDRRVYVFAWDRYVEYPSHDVTGNIEVTSYHIGNSKKFSKLGLIFGGLLFQIEISVEAIKLCKRVGQRPIIAAHDINTLPVACFLKLLGFASAVIYDCRELTSAVYSEWFNPVIGWFVGIIERKLLRCTRAVITVSERIAKYLADLGYPATVVYNCPRLSDVPACSTVEARKQLGLPAAEFIVSCVTTLRYGCGLDVLVAASKYLQGTIRVLIVGDGPLQPWLEREASRIDKNHLTLISRRPRKVALKYVKASNLTWAVYDAGSLNGAVGMPWKLFESIACGTPVTVESETLRSEFVETNGCGIILSNSNPIEVANIFNELSKNEVAYKQLSKHTEEISQKYTWEEESCKLRRILESIDHSHE
jgi:glycosyltransferase involved in cell wall biosynthesis